MTRWNSRRRLLDHTRQIEHAGVIEQEQPQLFREVFPYSEVCRIDFDHQIQPLDPPAQMLITDTTFRDGQQARPPYKV